MKNKIIVFSASLFVLLIFIYISTIAISLHRFHKAIFNNDEILIKETVDFTELEEGSKIKPTYIIIAILVGVIALLLLNNN